MGQRGPISNLWKRMSEERPAGFCWCGDAVYGDRLEGVHRVPAKREELSSYYDLLLNSSTPYYPLEGAFHFGTIDDHDMGSNNAGEEWAGRFWAGELFDKFLMDSNAISGSPVVKNNSRGRRSMGVYGVEVFAFGKEGKKVEIFEEEISEAAGGEHKFPSKGRYTNDEEWQKVAVFYLDCRTFKTEWYKGFDFFRTKGSTGDFLGAEQWSWFIAQLNSSDADVNVIVNGLQVLPSHRIPNGNLAEDWSKYPLARAKLYNAILKSGARSPILVSGDVHMSEIMRVDCVPPLSDENARARPIYEVTTSGITHSWGTFVSPQPDHRESWYFPYLSFLTGSLMYVAHYIMPWNEILIDDNGVQQFNLDLNFATFKFDRLAGHHGGVLVNVNGPSGTVMSHFWTKSQLSGTDDSSLMKTSPSLSSLQQSARSDHDWSCYPHRGQPGYFRLISSFTAFGLIVVTAMVGPLVFVCTVCYALRNFLQKLLIKQIKCKVKIN